MHLSNSVVAMDFVGVAQEGGRAEVHFTFTGREGGGLKTSISLRYYGKMQHYMVTSLDEDLQNTD